MADGIKKSDLIDDGAIDSIKSDLDALADSLEKNDKFFVSIAGTLKKDITPQLEKTSKGIRAINDAEIKSEKLLQQKLANEKKLSKVKTAQDKLIQAEINLREKLEQTLKGERDELIKLQEENRRATKEARDNVKATLDQADAYETLKRDTNKAQLEFKKLATQHGVNSKQAVEARRKFELLDEELREVNNAARDGRRDVGRYGDAIRGVRDNTLKWVAGITAAAASLKGLFTAANAQDQINKRLTTSFDLSGESLDRVSKKVEFLSRAYDTEVNEVIESATVLTNEFGIESEKAFGLIEQGFAKGANVRGEFLEQLKEYSTQFVNVGLSADEAIAVITQQENKGVFSDKGIDAIKEAGIRLTEMPKATQDALTAIGLSGEEIQRQITSGQKTVFEVTQEVSREIAKLPKNATEVGQVLADVFGGAGEDAKGFVLELGNVSTSLEDLDDTTTDFEKAQQKIIEKFIELKQNISNAVIPVFKFLAKNFETIVSVGGKLLLFFGVYKARMVVLNALNGKFGQSLKSIASAFKSGESNGKKFSGSLKSIGSALKGIGFAAAIAAAWELYKAWANIAFKTGQYEQFLKRQEAARARGGENAQKRVEEREKEFQDEINRINLLRSQGKKSSEQAEKEIKALSEARKKAVDSDIDTVKKRKLAALDELEAVRKAREKYLDRLGGEDIARGLAATQKLQGGGLILDTITEFDRQFTNAQAAVTGATAKLEIYRGESDSLTQSIIDQTITINENTGATGDSTKAIKEKTQSYKDLTDAINAAGEAENERLQLIEDFNISESEKNTQSAIDAANKIATETGVIEDGRIENALKREEELKRAQIERIFLVRVEESENAEQVELAMEQRNQALFLLDEELYNKKKDAINNLNELQESYAESLKNEVTTVEDNNEEIFNAFKNLQEALTDVLSEQIDARMNLLEKEKDAAKSRQYFYEALAANGNITAEKSIKKQIELQQEAEQEQERLAKIKQNVEMISAGLKTFTAAIEGGDTPAQALATTLTTTQVLASILGNINFFEKGTDNAPQGWAVVDEKGAEIHTDSKGNIKDLGSDKGARWKYLDAGDKIVTANKSAALINKFDQIGMSSIVNESKDNAGNSYDLMKLDQTLKGMTSKMDKLQTKIEVDWQGLAGGMARVNVHTTKGGDKRTERYTIR